MRIQSTIGPRKSLRAAYASPARMRPSAWTRSLTGEVRHATRLLNPRPRWRGVGAIRRQFGCHRNIAHRVRHCRGHFCANAWTQLNMRSTSFAMPTRAGCPSSLPGCREGWASPTPVGRQRRVTPRHGVALRTSDDRIQLTWLWLVASDCSEELYDLTLIHGLEVDSHYMRQPRQLCEDRTQCVRTPHLVGSIGPDDHDAQRAQIACHEAQQIQG
jgi:hypothetical protein